MKHCLQLILENDPPEIRKMTISGITSLIYILAEELYDPYHVDAMSHVLGIANILKQIQDKESLFTFPTASPVSRSDRMC